MRKLIRCFLLTSLVFIFLSTNIVLADSGTEFLNVIKSEGFSIWGDNMTGQGGAYDKNWDHVSEFDNKDISEPDKISFWLDLQDEYVEKGFIEDEGTYSSPYFIFSPWVSCVDYNEVSGNNGFLLTFWIYDWLSNKGYPNRMIIAAGGKYYDISNLSSSMDKENDDRYRMILTFGEDDMPLLDAITSGENITIRIYGQSGEFWQREVNANEDSMVSTRKLYQAYRKALDTVGAKSAQGTFLKMSIR